MPDNIDKREQRLIRVVARGSRFNHLAVDGEQLTLCCRIAEYRTAHMPRRDLCRRCVLGAHEHGLTVPA